MQLNSKNRMFKNGVAITNSGVFDVSQYTDGVGFKFSVYNASSREIKYVTVSVVGLNAVGDSAGTRTIKGVGPISAGEEATYSKEYLWFTDTVVLDKVIRLDVEYMDKTKRVFRDIENLYYPYAHLEAWKQPEDTSVTGITYK
jgi:ABC-type branched-subunit amino acid transport system ATPase component